MMDGLVRLEAQEFKAQLRIADPLALMDPPDQQVCPRWDPLVQQTQRVTPEQRVQRDRPVRQALAEQPAPKVQPGIQVRLEALGSTEQPAIPEKQDRREILEQTVRMGTTG